MQKAQYIRVIYGMCWKDFQHLRMSQLFGQKRKIYKFAHISLCDKVIWAQAE